MAETLTESRALWVAYFKEHPDTLQRLGYTDPQREEIERSLAHLESGMLLTDEWERVAEIKPPQDKTGRRLELKYHPKLQVHELTVYGNTPQNLLTIGDNATWERLMLPYGVETTGTPTNLNIPTMRMLAINKQGTEGGNDMVLAQAVHAGERLPRFGLRANEGFINSAAIKLGLATSFKVAADSRNRTYVVAFNNQPAQTWTELSKRFPSGNSSFWVLGRTPNVAIPPQGSPPRAA